MFALSLAAYDDGPYPIRCVLSVVRGLHYRFLSILGLTATVNSLVEKLN